jgi:hypothetical protein
VKTFKKQKIGREKKDKGQNQRVEKISDERK